MLKNKKNYVILTKLLVFLILLVNCSSNQKDNTPVALNDIEIYRSGLLFLEKKDF